MQIKVKNKRIGDNAPTFIVAEIGTNHNGNADLALKMVKEAKRAGVDAVKFQVVNPDESYARSSLSYKIFKKVYLDFEILKRLKKVSEKEGLIFFATPGDLSSLDLLVRLNIPLLKISSGCMTNILLLRKAARTKIPIIVSTGMSCLKEVKKAISELEKNGAEDIVILHCVSQYPANYESLNLNSLKILKPHFKYPIGYSDHSIGNLAPLVAVSLGAKVIEKHFTVDRNLKGPEHKFSSEPKDLKLLVDDIRSVEKIMGKSQKSPAEEEIRSRDRIRRFLVFTKDLAKDSVIKEDDMGIKRIPSGTGMSPYCYDAVVSKILKKNVKKDQIVMSNLLR